MCKWAGARWCLISSFFTSQASPQGAHTCHVNSTYGHPALSKGYEGVKKRKKLYDMPMFPLSLSVVNVGFHLLSA